MDFAAARTQMVRDQLASRDITDSRVLATMGEVPRELFISQEYRAEAYNDGPLPIGEGQTISQPYIVALMTQALHLQGNERVLEVGTGSGYQTAILAKLAREVYSIEMREPLASHAREVLESIGITNVQFSIGDGSLGWPQAAPYNAIIVTAASPQMPEPLMQQLAPEGRLVIPLGWRTDQELECWQRRGDAWHIERLSPVRFVPLVGKWGWRE